MKVIVNITENRYLFNRIRPIENDSWFSHRLECNWE